MNIYDLEKARRALPRVLTFPYFDDRESAWLLAQMMPEATTVGQLRKTPMARLLDRPAMKPVIARCGGTLRQRDVLAVAHADRALDMDDLSAAGMAGLEAAYARPWLDFTLSFDNWGTDRRHMDQTTRQDGNLVIQLGFPSDHAVLMGRYLPKNARKEHEFDMHPVRTHGCPTLAWARVDIDFENGEALIEEVQNDWLRVARKRVELMQESQPRARTLASLKGYEAGLVAGYGRVWPRAMLLAVLVVLRDLLGISRVWMHQPVPGVVFKRISGTPPPRSLYSALPKSYCFAPSRARPQMLRGLPARVTKALPAKGPLFWHLDLDPVSSAV